MIGKVKDIKVGTSIDLATVRRSFTPDMYALVGKFVELTNDEKNPDWLVMSHEYNSNKFAFHQDWIEIDTRRDVLIPIAFKFDTFKMARTKGGILNDDAMKALHNAIRPFDKSDGEFDVHIEWEDIGTLATEQSLDWATWTIGKKPLDQRYKEYTMKKYGVVVPDALCAEIAKCAKAHMSVQQNCMIGIAMSGTSWKAIVKDEKSGEVIDKTNVYAYKGWLLVEGGATVPNTETANLLCQFLGESKYEYSLASVHDVKNALCIHQKKERGAIATKTYRLGD